MIKGFAAMLLLGLAASQSAQAGGIRFDGNWKEQGFLRFWSNDYDLTGSGVRVTSDGTVSLLYRRAPRALRAAKTASWSWSVSQSVVATDLTVKGGDDRNLALYFVFVDKGMADKLANASARKLLTSPDTRALVYVWGGDYPRGKILFSPYGPNSLKTVIRRSAGTGSFSENVDLARDFRRAFGQDPGALVGIGITADSDDTDGKISAVISDLVVN
jgi:hypothetical protein